MKKFLFNILIMFGFTPILFSQQLPNNDFEQWINMTAGYDDPAYWTTPNFVTYVNPIYVLTVTKDESAYSGLAAVRLESQLIFTTIAPGLLTLGDLVIDQISQTSEIKGGIAFHDRPSKLKGFYKYDPSPGDNAVIRIYLQKYNEENGVCDTIASGVFLPNAAIDMYVPFEVVLHYATAETPDTLNIMVLPTDINHPMIGSVLSVDSFSLDYSGTPIVDLGNDTTIEQSMILDAGAGINYTYEWYKDGNLIINETVQNLTVTQTGNYSVIVRNENGLPAFDSIMVTVVNDIRELNNFYGFEAKYSKAEHSINVLLGKSAKNKELAISDITGRILLKDQISAIFTGTKKYSIHENGIYFIQITSGNNNFVKKLVVY